MPGTKILLIEPYYGGSHRAFLDGLRTHTKASYTLLSLKARKWKMRMQLSAPWFVKKLAERAPEERFFHLVLCSTFVDVAVFKALVERLPGWNRRCRFYTYYHENQFHYPSALPLESNHQFTAINFTTALVSDHVGFNSNYNRETFLSHSKRYIQKAADMELDEVMEEIARKTRVLYPGLDFSGIDACPDERRADEPPLIIWNHRWEHDKGPEQFFSALSRLQEQGIAFRLALLGQRFASCPDCFSWARGYFKGQIVQFGFVEDRYDYYRLLKQGDIVVSTARHEFFGMSVIEAVRAGCFPVLPNRLAYPELFERRFLYDGESPAVALQRAIVDRPTLSPEYCRRITDRYSWELCKKDYMQWFAAGNCC